MLFLVSFILVFSSSYFTASIFTKNFYEHFTYLMLTAFAQLILTFEVLSLFSAINVQNVLIFNIIIFALTFILWLKRQRPIFFPDFKLIFNKYLNVCKLDRSLIILSISFIIFLIGAFWLVLVLPITNADAVDYHVARSMFYILNGSLNHFDIADVRILTFPLNSEIIYAWVLLLLKKEAFLGGLSFFGYLLSIFSIVKFMRLAGFCLRKIVWSIFMVSSLASVLVQISGTETDVLTASLILSSVTLFWISFKDNKITNIIFSSIAYAIAVGTKTTAIIAIPAVAVIMLFLSYKYKNFKNFIMFCIGFVLNFLIFSAYIYIINFIDYGSIIGTKSSIVAHKNFFGIKGMVANFVRHIFLFFDFSGFKWGEYVGQYFLAVKLFILKLLHVSNVPEGIYSNPKGSFGINGTLIEPNMSFGILGFLVLLPCLVYSLIKLFISKNLKTVLLAVLSFSYLVFIIFLSYMIAYMNYNCRFLAMFAVIATPVLSYSYYKKQNILKVIFTVFMIYYLVLVSSHLWARTWWHYAKSMIYNGETISDIRLKARCANYSAKKGEIYDSNCIFWLNFRGKENLAKSRVLYISSAVNNLFLPATLKYFDGINIDFGIIPNIETYNLDNYDYIVFSDKSQYLSFLPDKNLPLVYKIQDNNIKIEKKQSHYCFYLTQNGIFKNNKNIDELDLKDRPYSEECIIDSNFLASHNFYKISIFSDIDKSDEKKFPFVVYKNFKK